jgi:signal transduction histidine kinase
MLAAVALVAALAFWDARRESAAALDDFADEQATLAGSVASELGTRLVAVRRDALLIAESLEQGRPAPAPAVDGYTSYARRPVEAPPRPSPDGFTLSVPASLGQAVELVVPPAKLLEGAMRVERPGLVRLLVLGPAGGVLRGTDGRAVHSETLQRALDAGQPSAWLDRREASALGLVQRRAAAGLGVIDAGPLGRWAVAVVTSAVRVREREERALWRLVLGLSVAGGLVVMFGTAALQRQRRSLLLERQLALSALGRERDAELATASKAAVMGTLAMGVAHEISTPLGIIAGRAEQLLARVQDDPRASRAAQAVLEQTERIRLTIRGFLDLVRGAAPVLGDTEPSAVLDGAVALVEHRFAASGVTLSRDVPPDLPAIRGDVPMLQQALVNLLLNACDACARGGHVDARLRGDGDHVAFSVLDDGPGITAEAAGRATEPFFTTKPLGQGTGLGLAIANEIVKMHRGTLTLRAASPRGTCASVIVPIAKAEVEHAA